MLIPVAETAYAPSTGWTDKLLTTTTAQQIIQRATGTSWMLSGFRGRPIGIFTHGRPLHHQ